VQIRLKGPAEAPIPEAEREKRFRSVPSQGGAAMFDLIDHLAWTWPDLFWWLR
jgi:hypothetical protein